MQSDLSRHQTSLLMQLCMGHVPLNFYLHRIKKEDTSNCNTCQGQEPPAKETITHFLFECQPYNKEWHELDCKMRRDSRDLSTLLRSEKGIKALVSYIDKTGRLTHTKGDYLISWGTFTHTQPHRYNMNMWWHTLHYWLKYMYKPASQGTPDRHMGYTTTKTDDTHTHTVHHMPASNWPGI